MVLKCFVLYLSSLKEKQKRIAFPSSMKREIRKFHVVLWSFGREMYKRVWQHVQRSFFWSKSNPFFLSPPSLFKLSIQESTEATQDNNKEAYSPVGLINSVSDPDLRIRGAGGKGRGPSRPWDIRGEGGLKNVFSTLWALVWSNNSGGRPPRVLPLDPPL